MAAHVEERTVPMRPWRIRRFVVVALIVLALASIPAAASAGDVGICMVGVPSPCNGPIWQFPFPSAWESWLAGRG